MVKINKFFFTLSGENIKLAQYEIISILELTKIKYINVKLLDRLLIISCEKNILNYLASRVVLTHNISELLIECPCEEKAIIKALKMIDLDLIVKNKKNFAVRIQKIGHKSINSEYYEKMIGKIIQNQIKNKISVNLKKPELLFFGIFVKNRFVFGINLFQKRKKNFKLIPLQSRPFFHPSALNPRLARVMVNLSQIKEDEIFLDPFCGTGSILIEAYLIGCLNIIGIDINQKMIKGAKKNLKKFSIEDKNLLIGDSNHIPLREISAVATDPPYGRSSSTHKKPLPILLEKFFLEISDIISKNKFITLALPSHIILSNLIDRYNFKIIQDFTQYIHSSLTRKIYIIQKI